MRKNLFLSSYFGQFAFDGSHSFLDLVQSAFDLYPIHLGHYLLFNSSYSSLDSRNVHSDSVKFFVQKFRKFLFGHYISTLLLSQIPVKTEAVLKIAFGKFLLRREVNIVHQLLSIPLRLYVLTSSHSPTLPLPGQYHEESRFSLPK